MAGDPRRRARYGLTIYVAIVLAFSAVIEAVIIARPDIDGPFIVALIFCRQVVDLTLDGVVECFRAYA